MSGYRILIIDDDRNVRSSLVDLLEAAGWTAKSLARATETERWIMQFSPEVILSDVRMPDMTGIELLQNLTNAPPVVLISAHGDIPMAVDAMNLGAYSFVEKPYEPKRLLSILSHAAEQHRMRQSNLRLRDRMLQLAGLDRILIGEMPVMQRLRDTISTVADSSASVLIHGETGTGKDLVARALHDISPRCGGPYIAMHAAQFGVDQLVPLARSAAGGTLFLDEICACPLEVQSSLLRLIDTNEILVPCEGAPETIDLRIISATNEDTNAAVGDGRLRQDLLYRLDTFALQIPPLSERLDDIAPLALSFLGEFAAAYGTEVPELDGDDWSALLAYDWPGNVRELRNVAERRVIMGRNGVTSMVDVMPGNALESSTRPGLREAVAAFERQVIGKAIQSNEGRMEDVALELGIGRRTLNEKIVKLGLDKEALL